jgi:predicted Zn-dependent protease
MAGVPVTGFTVFLNTTAAGVSAGNAVTTNSNGTVSGVGTVIGTLQGAQSAISIGTTGITSNAVPAAGAAFGTIGAIFYATRIATDLAAGNAPLVSDIAGFVNDVASAVASGATVAMAVIPASDGAGTILVPLYVASTVISAGAGAAQLVASAEGWTVGPSGNLTQVSLSANQWTQAAAQAQSINSNPTTLTSALNDVGINSDAANTFLVPQVDSNGNVTGFSAESPVAPPTQLADGVTQYTFANGVTFNQQASQYTMPGGATNIVVSPTAQWAVPLANGGTTTLNLGASGSGTTTVTDKNGVVLQQSGVNVTTTESNGITTTTQTFTSNLSGPQNQLQNQVSSNGASTSEQSTVFNSDGSVSYTENISSTSGVITSDVINANTNASLAIAGENVVLNGVSGNIVSIAGQNDIANLSNGSVTFTANAAGTLNGSGNAVAVGQNDTATIAGGSNMITANGSASGSTFTLQGTGTNSDTVNLAGATDLTVLLGDATTDAGFVATNATVNSLNGGGIVNGATGDNLNILGVNVTLNATGGQYSLTGNGATANASNSTLAVGTDDQAAVNGNSDVVNASAGSLTTLYGTGSIVNLASSSNSIARFTEANSSNTVNGTGNSVGIFANGDNVASSGNTFQFSTSGLSTNITGDSNLVEAGGASVSTLYGTGNVVDLVNNNGSIVRFDEANSSNTVNGTGNYVGIFANGDNVASSGNTFQFSTSGLSTNITGDSNVVEAGGSSVSTLYGTGNVVDLINNNGSIVRFDEANSSNTVNGTGNYVGVFANGDNVASSGNTFQFSAGGFNTGINGNSNVVETGGASVSTLYGTGNLVDMVANSGSIVRFTEADAANSINGTGNYVGVFSTGQNITSSGNTFQFSADGLHTIIDGNSNVVQAAGQSATTLNGNSNVVDLIANSGSSVSVGTADSSNTVNGAGNLIGILANGDTVTSTGNLIQFGSGGFTSDVAGNGNTIDTNIDSATGLYGINSLVHMVSNSNSSLDFFAGAEGTVTGKGNTIGIYGSDATVYASGDTVENSEPGFTGDVIEGTGDSGVMAGDDYIDRDGPGAYGGPGDGSDSGGSTDDGGGGGYGYYGAPGLSGSTDAIKSDLTSDIASIAQYDAPSGNSAALAAASNGLSQAAEMANDSPVSAGAGPNVLEGARWDSGTITWSIADSPGTAAASFSGYMGSQYETEIENAFAAWAAASGLKFQEVADSSQSDIRIGWGDLGGSSTGEVGFTSFKAAHGVMSSDAIIELEDPTLDALATGANGDQTYSGTDATLSQVLQHEIGHALGLADNADAGSIMNYNLTSANQTLDSTDINAIQALYGSPSGSGSNTSQMEALIQAMAGFAPTTSAQTSLPLADSSATQTPLLATTH